MVVRGIRRRVVGRRQIDSTREKSWSFHMGTRFLKKIDAFKLGKFFLTISQWSSGRELASNVAFASSDRVVRGYITSRRGGCLCVLFGACTIGAAGVRSGCIWVDRPAVLAVLCGIAENRGVL